MIDRPDDEQAPHSIGPSVGKSWLVALLLAWSALTVGMLALRVQTPSFTESEAGVFFWDNDTVRRLVRLEAIGEASEYPVHNLMDGYPTGSTSHWTLPMDWLIRGLDRALPKVHPKAKPHESGAAWAGVVLAGLGGLLCLVLAIRWLGIGRGAAVASLYAVCVPVHVLTQFGNGDHAALHHVLLVPGLLGWACLVNDRGSTVVRVATGVALGLAMWVSTETMAVLAVLGLAMAAELSLAPNVEVQSHRLRDHLGWLVPCWVTCAIGAWVERAPSGLALEWDRISGFQLVIVGLLVAFGSVALGLRQRLAAHFRWLPTVAGLVTGGAMILCALVIAPLGDGIRGQLSMLTEANRWTQTCVREYAPLWIDPATQTIDGTFARAILTWWIYPFPVLAWFFLCNARIPLAGRVATLVVTLGALALLCLEIKFAHLFTVLYLPILVCGGAELLRQVLQESTQRRFGYAVGAAVLLASFAWPLQNVYAGDDGQRRDMAIRAHMLDALQRLDANPEQPQRTGVLAQWGLGAHIPYYAHKPAVASGYHRNLHGIRASFTALTRTDLDEAHDLLTDRLVGWVVRKADAGFLYQVGDVFPDLGVFGTLRPVVRDGQAGLEAALRPDVQQSLWARLDGEVSEATGFRRVYHSPLNVSVLGKPAPIYQIYEVLPR